MDTVRSLAETVRHELNCMPGLGGPVELVALVLRCMADDLLEDDSLINRTYSSEMYTAHLHLVSLPQSSGLSTLNGCGLSEHLTCPRVGRKSRGTPN